MRYSDKAFGFAYGGKTYSKGWEETFGKRDDPAPESPKLEGCNICDSLGFIDADGAACLCSCAHGQKIRDERKERERVRAGLSPQEPDFPKLLEAVRALYYRCRWVPETEVMAFEEVAKLWEDVRDAAGFEPGKSPK